jgi:hypothetical protein
MYLLALTYLHEQHIALVIEASFTNGILHVLFKIQAIALDSETPFKDHL